jgi:hypothetical protein
MTEEQAEALHTRSQKVSANGESQMAHYFRWQNGKHQRQRAAAHGKYKVVADTGSVLGALVSSYRGLVMPDMHTRQLVDVPMPVEQSQA